MNEKLLHRVRAHVERGERISVDDCRGLFSEKNLLALAKPARVARERRFGGRAFYRAVHRVNYDGRDPAEFLADVEQSLTQDVPELAIHCRWVPGETSRAWRDRLRALSRASIPVTVHISAGFIAGQADAEQVDDRKVIEELRLGSSIFITGEEAELFPQDVRARIAPEALNPDRWFQVHRAAHELGLRTGAAMTYAPTNRFEASARHLEMLRALQDDTGGFLQFVPMALYDRNAAARHLTAPTAAQTLRVLAVSRMFLDNIPHIAVPPRLVTPEVAYVALNHGADTIDPSVTADDVHAREQAAPAELELAVMQGDGAEGNGPIAGIESRLQEARWTPVPVGTFFVEAVQPAVGPR